MPPYTPLTPEERRVRRKKRQRQQRIAAIVVLVLALLLLAGLVFGIRAIILAIGGGAKKPMVQETAAPPTAVETILAEADALAASYDYDAAVEKIKSVGDNPDERLSAAIARYEETKATMVPYTDMSTVPHVFVHTLIKDTAKAFDGEYTEAGYNQYMTTISEFQKMLQSMYDRGFVLIDIHDMASVVKAADGTEKMQANTLYLPAGKKPIVLSQDDVSYYGYMTPDGFAARLVIGEDGYPTCEYVEDDGSITRGSFDMVPMVEDFIRLHPDFSYRGARGALAITGYDGVLGYRTCPTGDGYNAEDIPKATAVATRMRELGWTFASHSWGHKKYGEATVANLQTDAQKWDEEVRPILGDTDVIIYANGNDIAGIEDYSGEKYDILRGFGFRYFCNVDAHDYWVQLRDGYLRQGRRNLDGYRMYYNPEMLDDLFDVSAVFDAARPVPVPPI